jgi:hypothetical protein
MPSHPECGWGGLNSAESVFQSGNWRERIPKITRNPRLKSLCFDTICLRRIFAGIGAVLFICGLFIPSVRYISPKTPVSIFNIHPLFSIVYLVFAVIALILILLHYSLIPQIIGTILGIYLIIIAIPAILNGILDIGFGVLVTGDILLIVGVDLPES